VTQSMTSKRLMLALLLVLALELAGGLLIRTGIGNSASAEGQPALAAYAAEALASSASQAVSGSGAMMATVGDAAVVVFTHLMGDGRIRWAILVIGSDGRIRLNPSSHYADWGSESCTK
jgi:hypothetical protein